MTLKNTKENFWNYVEKTENCWLWKGTIHHLGYGVFWKNNKQLSAHRYSFKLKNGNDSIPYGFVICHTCDNKICVNPEHLFIGTQSDNIKDAAKKERMKGQKGEKNNKAKLTLEQVNEIKKLASSNGWLTQEELAKQYGVTFSTIGRILRGEIWK